MQPKCVQAVTLAAKAAGRKPPTQAQLADIESRISRSMHQIAREDGAAWASMTEQQRYLAGAQRAMADIQAEAAKKLEQAHLQIQRTAETEARIESMKDATKGSRADALSRDFIVTDRMATAERKTAIGRMMSLIEAASSKEGASIGRKALMFLFDAENPTMTRDIVREVFKNADGSTGNALASKAARAWLDTIEELRTRFNSAGGDVGKLEYGYTPQPHDTAKIRKAGVDAWVNSTMPLLDRSRYLYDDGARMSDDDLRDMLRGVYETLRTEGLNTQTPGAFKGSGKRANRGSDHRAIHFADGDAWIDYMRQFGRGSIYDAMLGHVSRMTKDITLVERYGPDVNGQARLQLDEARVADGKSASDPLTNWHTVDPETYFKLISGQVGMPKSEPLARTASMVRNLQTAAKLGGAVISSVTDLGTLAITAGYNRLPYWQLVKDIRKAGTAEAREFMSAHGMIAESVADHMNRWSGDHIGTNWSGKLANSVMRWSMLNAWTDGLRQGFTLTMNAKMADLAGKAWGTLDEFDRVRLQRAGFTEADWTTLQGVAPTQFRGRALLTPQAIKDAAISQPAPAPAKGMVRYYHGGSPEGVTGSLWFTSHLPDAEGWASRSTSMKVWFVDVPENHPVRGGDPTFGVLPPSRMELPPEFANLRKPLIGPSAIDGVAANQLAAKVFGFIHDESEYAVINPDLTARAFTTWGGQQAGTIPGELARTVMQFKAFPTAMVTRHWRRMLEGDMGADGGPMAANRTAYSMGLLVTLMGLGAIATQSKQILQGKDPISMDPTDGTGARFWAKAAMQGGGLSILGDLFLVDPSASFGDQAGNAAKNIMGPTFGTVGDLALKNIAGNIWEAAQGKDTHWEAELTSWAKSNTPGASLWWVKPMIDHGFMNAVNESLSPGYLARQKQRAAKEWGQRYWWAPEDVMPDRAPDLTTAAGR